MAEVSEEFVNRFTQLPKLVRERLAVVAASALDDSVSGDEHQRLLSEWHGDGFPGTAAENIEYGWVLERMNTETVCEWVIQQQVDATD